MQAPTVVLCGIKEHRTWSRCGGGGSSGGGSGGGSGGSSGGSSGGGTNTCSASSVEHFVLNSYLEGLSFARSPLRNKLKNGASRWLEIDGSPVRLYNSDLETGARGTTRWVGGHTENQPVVMLFHLLTWDIFWSGSGQSCGLAVEAHADTPPSLLTGAFTARQREQIDAFGAQLRSVRGNALYELVCGKITCVWKRCYGVQHRGVSWCRFTAETLCAIATGLGGVALSRIVHVLCYNYESWCGGLPDLCVWYGGSSWSSSSSGDGGGSGGGGGGGSGMGGGVGEDCWETRMIEVKGPNDALSDTQKAWLSLMVSSGVEVVVVHVEDCTKKSR